MDQYRKFAVNSIARGKNTRIYYKICVKCLRTAGGSNMQNRKREYRTMIYD